MARCAAGYATSYRLALLGGCCVACCASGRATSYRLALLGGCCVACCASGHAMLLGEPCHELAFGLEVS